MQRQSKLLHGALVLCDITCNIVWAQVGGDIATQQLQRQQQRERAQNEQAEEQPDIRLPRTPAPIAADYPLNETPCFPIRRIELKGDGAAQFAWAPKAAEDAIGLCPGSGGINAILGKVQNALVGRLCHHPRAGGAAGLAAWSTTPTMPATPTPEASQGLIEHPGN